MEEKIKVHVTLGKNKKTIETTPREFVSDVRCEFGVSHGYIAVEKFVEEWCGVEYISPSDIVDGCKLKIKVCSRPWYVPSQSLTPSLPAVTSHVKISPVLHASDAAESVLQTTPFHFKIPRFPENLKKKLSRKEPLDTEDTTTVISQLGEKIKLFTYYPTLAHLSSAVKAFFYKYPYVVSGYNFKVAEDIWVKMLHEWFVQFGIKVAKKEQKHLQIESTTVQGEYTIQNTGNCKTDGACQAKQDKAIQTIPQAQFEDMSFIIEKMKEEWCKPERNMNLIRKWMQITFQSRINFIVCDMPRISTVKERFPALFNSDAVKEDFWRITVGSPDALKTKIFHQNLKQYSDIVLNLKNVDKSMKEIIWNAMCTQEDFDERIVPLLLIPSLLGEDLSFLHFHDGSNREQVTPWINCNCSLLETVNGKGDYEIYIENVSVCGAGNLVDAVESFVACFFTFNIHYPTRNHKTLQIVQALFLEVEDNRVGEPLEVDVMELINTLKKKLRKDANKSCI